ncbi:protein YgfX [Pseudomonas sp. ABC1]|uniref:protein YgfX n=1 Tax=Pseudomonas sp. ABC1 TaxID=2748080 RepID=UPI002119D80E|nr:protein YgfX [Pseudomonas sp. ABC1]
MLWVVACVAVLQSGAPLVLMGAMLAFCLVHAVWFMFRFVFPNNPGAWCRLRHDAQGWHLWCAGQGWQDVTLCTDTLASPLLIVLRLRRPGRLFAESLCLPADAMSPDDHRRLRVLLRFSRHRWAVAE